MCTEFAMYNIPVWIGTSEFKNLLVDNVFIVGNMKLYFTLFIISVTKYY